ncbi:MAG: hypothetical protein AAGH78_03620 [Cyanobacteria bacterium P01_H01_bin.58]
MRVYTNQPLRALWAYGKFAATVLVLFVLASQAVKIWGNEPAVKELKELTEQVQGQ